MCLQKLVGYLRFFFRFILECVFGNAFKCCINIESFFGRCLKVRNVSFRCTPCLCFLLRNLTQYEIYERLEHYSSETKGQRRKKASHHSALATINIGLVPQHNKREVLRIWWTSLNNDTAWRRCNIWTYNGTTECYPNDDMGRWS